MIGAGSYKKDANPLEVLRLVDATLTPHPPVRPTLALQTA